MREVVLLLYLLIVSLSVAPCRPEGESTEEPSSSGSASEAPINDPGQSGISTNTSAIPSDTPPVPSDPYASPKMDASFWYDPAAGQVCHEESGRGATECRTTSMTCVLESDHGHEYYRCQKQDGNYTIEIVFHHDPGTGKFLLCVECSSIPPPPSVETPAPSPSPDPALYPPMNPNVWYDPANNQVCLRNSETQNVTCMVTTLPCSLEQEHGHKFYRCVRDGAGDRMEIIYHEDPVTGKYLFLGSFSPAPTQSTQ